MDNKYKYTYERTANYCYKKTYINIAVYIAMFLCNS